MRSTRATAPTADTVAPDVVREHPTVTDGTGLTRRQLVGGAAAATVAAWTPAFRTGALGAAPTRFPAGIELYRQGFVNWSQAIRVDALWTCAPRTPQEVVAVANWAHAHGYRVRARGHMHTWSPLTVVPGRAPASRRVVLVDTTRHLTGVTMASATTVRAQAGAGMEAVLTLLERHGLGFTATPAPGDITVGGALAIGGHGTAVAARGERRAPGQTFGSLSNRITELTVVAWSARRRRYVLRTIPRDHPDAAAFLTHVGRAFVTEATLRAGRDDTLRCQSFVDIPASELFAAPGTGGAQRTLASFLDATGRVEAIWFPFTDRPWLKVWSVAKDQPAGATAATAPYNYAFADAIDLKANDALDRATVRDPASTPALGRLALQTTESALAAAGADLWGPSKNLLLYVRPTTLRVTANGYAILTRRRDVQRVVARFVAFYDAALHAAAAQGDYPVNGPLEIRVTGLDHPADVGVDGARAPALSPLSPRPDRPELDVAVWLDLLTFPDTPGADAFMRRVERWIFATFTSPDAEVRPEWSKGWAYTTTQAWDDPTVLHRRIPAAYRAGRGGRHDWDWARGRLHAADPHRVFSNAFLDRLLG